MSAERERQEAHERGEAAAAAELEARRAVAANWAQYEAVVRDHVTQITKAMKKAAKSVAAKL